MNTRAVLSVQCDRCPKPAVFIVKRGTQYLCADCELEEIRNANKKNVPRIGENPYSRD